MRETYVARVPKHEAPVQRLSEGVFLIIENLNLVRDSHFLANILQGII